ncbi:DUF1456 family protein [Sulfurovum riftiae]|uniref:DUF1456 domain-containing protein n=1 Tax=Sulfurovum riftiae TaxID=1630136 RepID=A0A151CFF6_9BACT|nr:DUF1456 family protein [Sulfurovum riftiae]KYJ85993.1 hypothetical protein AS592_05250 [Sulfurovum riftiae]
MKTNDILYKISKALSLTQEEMIEAYRLEGYEMTPSHLEALLKKRIDKDFSLCSYEELGVFLDGLVTLKRGPSPKRPNDDEAVPLTNNLILKKLRIALELKEPETEIIFGLGDATLSKQELKSLFRKEDHKNFKACTDDLLMAFLEGLDEFYYTGAEV